MKNRKILVMGGGVIERRNCRYYGKSAVVNYLHEISRFYEETIFLTLEHNFNDLFCTPLNTNKVKLYIMKSGKSKVCALYKDIRAVAKHAKGSHTILFSPNPWHSVLFPFVKLFASHVAIYIAGDWTVSDRPWGTKTTMKYILKNAYIVFTRGHTYKLAKAYNQNVWESMPIIPFNILPIEKSTRLSKQNNKSISLLTISVLRKLKGTHYILLAVHSLLHQKRKSFNSLHLNIVGDGEHKEFLDQEISRLNIEEYITFHGYIDNPEKLAEFYMNSDIFVFHSFHEGHPRVLDEAVIFRLPIIAANLPGIKNKFKHGHTALLFEPGSHLELADCIQELIENRELSNHLADNAANKYRYCFEFRSAAEQHAALLKTVV